MVKESKCIFWSGIVLILIVGAIHLFDARDSFYEAAYKGWLFYANGFGSILAACGMFWGRRWGWLLGLFIAFGSLAGYVASRTIGLPFIPPEPQDWLEPLGVTSLIVEGFYIMAFVKMDRAK